MATTPTQIRIDAELKKEASELFTYLGLDMSTAVNLFLRQCVLRGGLPFKVEVPRYNAETEAALQESKDILTEKIPAKSYGSARELFADLDAETE